jgi:hypothetical protein
MKRVITTADSGKYNCLTTQWGCAAAIWNDPPRCRSRILANTLGESKRGQQNQSILPSTHTSAAVCKSPISAWSAIGG